MWVDDGGGDCAADIKDDGDVDRGDISATNPPIIL